MQQTEVYSSALVNHRPASHREIFLLIDFLLSVCCQTEMINVTWLWGEGPSPSMNLDKTLKAHSGSVIHQVIICCHLLSPFSAPQRAVMLLFLTSFKIVVV